jgi:hypothetical protein
LRKFFARFAVKSLTAKIAKECRKEREESQNRNQESIWLQEIFSAA